MIYSALIANNQNEIHESKSPSNAKAETSAAWGQSIITFVFRLFFHPDELSRAGIDIHCQLGISATRTVDYMPYQGIF
jgi:hypothetical protein